MPHLQTGAEARWYRQDKLTFEHDGEVEVAKTMFDVATGHKDQCVGCV